MDIKLSSVRVILLIAVLALVVEATSAGYRNRGPRRFTPRRHSRREVRDHLAPPSQDASYISYGSPSLDPPPLIPYRPGQFMNPPPSTEAPGYFSRLASWLNPFGGSPTPPPLSDLPATRYLPKYGPPDTYGPPSQSYGAPAPHPPPPGPYGYRPAKAEGKNCNPCNNVPWIPLPGVASAYGPGTSVDIQPSIGQEVKNAGGDSSSGYGEGIPSPDFSYGTPANSQSHQGNAPSGPIPYPHLYPGPMPPLYKAKPFDDHSSASIQPIPSIEIAPGPPVNAGDSIPTVSGTDHVEVLPPGAEVDTSGLDSDSPTGYVGEIRDTPPPGYSYGNNHGSGYESTSLNVQKSPTVHEEHLSTQLNVGYGVEGPSGNVEVVKSITTAEYSAPVDHGIHYEQSPVIDLTQKQQNNANDYASGLNPPPNVSPQGYDSGPEVAPGGGVLKNSYGQPVGNQQSGLPADSFGASTVTNRTVVEPTSAYRIPDVGELPISHETTELNNYENYPPSTEKFLISVQDPVNTDDIQRINVSSQVQGDFGQQDHGRAVDSYQRDIDHPGQSGIQNAPVPLVPYRPSQLYVPYPPYSGSSGGQGGSLPPTTSGPTTEEPFLDALLKSYDNFKQEMAARDQLLVPVHQERTKAESQRNEAASAGTTWVSQPQPSFALPEQINPSVYVSGNMMPPPPPSYGTNNQQQAGTNRNKQVQIIIPYTSQYTPSPFQPVTDDWSGRGALEQPPQGRKVPVLDAYDQNYVGQESNIVQVTKPLRPLENLLIREVKKPESVKQTNNSIDVTRLQKNIDNWTIQEYSRGITSSTALPSSSHPYLLPSKKIPNEYLSSNRSSVSEERIDTNQPDVTTFNDNDVEQERAASSRVDVPHVQVLSIDVVPKPFEREAKSSATVPLTETTTPPSSSSTSTTTQASWDELPVSISPHNNERVYVVTPQPVRSPKSSSKFGDADNPDKSDKFEAIERAYQVLPQAVNNLASASVSGPENSLLWGIMDHDQYARNDKGDATNLPILYSGHSKVSNARSH